MKRHFNVSTRLTYFKGIWTLDLNKKKLRLSTIFQSNKLSIVLLTFIIHGVSFSAAIWLTQYMPKLSVYWQRIDLNKRHRLAIDSQTYWIIDNQPQHVLVIIYSNWWIGDAVGFATKKFLQSILLHCFNCMQITN